jgi:hypothetical protein
VETAKRGVLAIFVEEAATDNIAHGDDVATPNTPFIPPSAD